MEVTYARKNWVDEAVQYPERYEMKELSAGMVTLTPSPGLVDTRGTPQSAVNFNHLERGVLDAQVALALLALHVRHQENMPDWVSARLKSTK